MYSKYGCKRRDPPLPPKAKVLPWIGTTVDYIKAGPSSGERFHKELGPIYRCKIASTAVMDVCLTRNSFGEQSECMKQRYIAVLADHGSWERRLCMLQMPIQSSCS